MDSGHWPTTISSYKLLNEIGGGTYSRVFAALVLSGRNQGSRIAIKCCDLEGQTDVVLQEVIYEYHTAELVLNQSVSALHTCFAEDNQMYFVMPLAEYGSLRDILNAAYPAGIKEESLLASILQQVLQGLDALHARGKAHKDLKCSNLLVTEAGYITLSDFGAPYRLKAQLARHEYLTSPNWAAPEIFVEQTEPRFLSDIWSFGITALELALGQPPHIGYPSMKIALMVAEKDPPRLAEDDWFGSEFKDLIRQCLTKTPADRPRCYRLLQHPFFGKSQGNRYVKATLLSQVPAVYQPPSPQFELPSQRPEKIAPVTSYLETT